MLGERGIFAKLESIGAMDRVTKDRLIPGIPARLSHPFNRKFFNLTSSICPPGTTVLRVLTALPYPIAGALVFPVVVPSIAARKGSI